MRRGCGVSANLVCEAPLLPSGAFQFDARTARPLRLRKTITAAARHFEDECSMEDQRRGRPSYRRLFVTLTYAENTRGDPNDIKELVRHVRQWAGRCGERVRYRSISYGGSCCRGGW